MAHFANFELDFTDERRANINKAFQESPRKIGTALKQHETLVELLADILFTEDLDDDGNPVVDSDIFDDETIFLIFEWNSKFTREQSLLLGLKADYPSANAILRSCLDGYMKGAFINILLDESKRDKINLSKDLFYSDDVNIESLLEYVDNNKAATGQDFLNKIVETENDGIFQIRPRDLRGILSDLGYFTTYDGTEVADLYHELGDAVHMNFNGSQADQSIVANGHPFPEAPTHVPILLDQYLENFQRCVDLMGSLLIAEFGDYIHDNDRIYDNIVGSNHEFLENGLNHTYSALSEVSKYTE